MARAKILMYREGGGLVGWALPTIFYMNLDHQSPCMDTANHQSKIVSSGQEEISIDQRTWTVTAIENLAP